MILNEIPDKEFKILCEVPKELKGQSGVIYNIKKWETRLPMNGIINIEALLFPVTTFPKYIPREKEIEAKTLIDKNMEKHIIELCKKVSELEFKLSCRK